MCPYFSCNANIDFIHLSYSFMKPTDIAQKDADG